MMKKRFIFACMLLLNVSIASTVILAQTTQIEFFPIWQSGYRISGAAKAAAVGDSNGQAGDELAVATTNGAVIAALVIARERGVFNIVYKNFVPGDDASDIDIEDTDRDLRKEIIVAGHVIANNIPTGIVFLLEHDGVPGHQNYLPVYTFTFPNYDVVKVIAGVDLNRNNEPELIIAQNARAGPGGKIDIYEHTGPIGQNTYTANPIHTLPTAEKIADIAIGDSNRNRYNDIIFTTSPNPSGSLALNVLEYRSPGGFASLQVPLGSGVKAKLAIGNVDGVTGEEIIVGENVNNQRLDALVIRGNPNNAYTIDTRVTLPLRYESIEAVDVDTRPDSSQMPPYIILGTSTFMQPSEGRFYVYDLQSLQAGTPRFTSSQQGSSIFNVVSRQAKGGRADLNQDGLDDIVVVKNDLSDQVAIWGREMLSILSSRNPHPGEFVQMEVFNPGHAGDAYKCGASFSYDPNGFPPLRYWPVQGTWTLQPDFLLATSFQYPLIRPFTNFDGVLNSQGRSPRITFEVPPGDPRVLNGLRVYFQCYLTSSLFGLFGFTNDVAISIVAP